MRTIQRLKYYCHFAKTGYSRAAQDYLLALDRYGDVELQVVPIGTEGDLEFRYRALGDLRRELDSPDVAIYHAQPSALVRLAPTLAERDPGAKKVAITTWETSALPEEFARALTEFDLVIVPSQFCRASMDYRYSSSPTGLLYSKVAVVPHCFDPEWWWNGEGAPRTENQDRGYRFYSIGAWCERKNHLGLLAAYFHAFTRDDPVSLMLISAGADMNAIRSLIARSGVNPARLPELHVPAEPLTEDQLLELHLGADCFVSATRAEGFGLPHFEAGFMGRQIVSPLYGGHRDFLESAPNVWTSGYNLTPCFGSEVRGQIVEENGQLVQESRVAIPPGLDCRQVWAEPDLIDIAMAMERMVDGVDTRLGRDGDTVTQAYSNYRYEPVATQLLSVLEDM